SSELAAQGGRSDGCQRGDGGRIGYHASRIDQSDRDGSPIWDRGGDRWNHRSDSTAVFPALVGTMRSSGGSSATAFLLRGVAGGISNVGLAGGGICWL